MEPKPTKDVYNEIAALINKQGGAYSTWYCGIASDWEDRLFNEHQVSRTNSWWIALQCYNNAAARNVEKALLELGCDGGAGGGDETTIYAYAYLKSAVANP